MTTIESILSFFCMMNTLIILVVFQNLSSRMDTHMELLKLQSDTMLKLMDLEKEQ